MQLHVQQRGVMLWSMRDADAQGQLGTRQINIAKPNPIRWHDVVMQFGCLSINHDTGGGCSNIREEHRTKTRFYISSSILIRTGLQRTRKATLEPFIYLPALSIHPPRHAATCCHPFSPSSSNNETPSISVAAL